MACAVLKGKDFYDEYVFLIDIIIFRCQKKSFKISYIYIYIPKLHVYNYMVINKNKIDKVGYCKSI